MACVRRVKDLDHKLVFALGDDVGYVKGEGIVAAGVLADELAVDPYAALPIHRAEVKQGFFAAEFLADGELSAVPKALLGQQSLADARELGFDRERHKDLAVVFLRRIGGVARDGVVIFAVEANPVFALKLRSRVLRKRETPVNFIKPWSSYIAHFLAPYPS